MLLPTFAVFLPALSDIAADRDKPGQNPVAQVRVWLGHPRPSLGQYTGQDALELEAEQEGERAGRVLGADVWYRGLGGGGSQIWS